MNIERATLVEMTKHWPRSIETNRLNLTQVKRKLILGITLFLFTGCEQINRLTNGSNSSDGSGSSSNEVVALPIGIESEPTLIDDYVVFPENHIANTGIGYNSRQNELIFAAWDSKIDRNYLLITDMNLNHLYELDLTGKIRFLQGVTYEKERDLIWVWGTRPNTPFAEWTDCFGLYAFDRCGTLVDSLPVPMLEWYAGMISYAGNGKMWLKANTKSIARLYDMNLGMALVKEVETGIGGEGIAVDDKGNIWVHGECKIKRINPETLESSEWVSPNAWCSEEGMVFDGMGHLWIGSDDGYHFNLEGGNHVWKLRV